MISDELAGRVAVITGASSGIGAATAVALAERGAPVALLARRADRLRDLATHIRGAGGTALPIPGDITDADHVRAAARIVQGQLGDASILFNNAGVMLPGPSDDPSLQADRELQLRLNVHGLVACVDAFVEQLRASAASYGVADILNTGSLAGEAVFHNFAVYGATKAFVRHYSTHLRSELGSKNIRVGTLTLGIVGETELNSHVTDQATLDWLGKSHDAIEWLRPRDVADAVTFVVSRSPHVNYPNVTLMPTHQQS